MIGTASDNWHLGQVWYQLNAQGWTNAVTTNGWTNWSASLTLFPGTNKLAAYAVDSTGNKSTTNTVSFQYVVTNLLQLSTVGLGTLSPNYSNAWLEIGRAYSITAAPSSGFVFTNWTISTNGQLGVKSNSAALQFTMASNLTLQAAFLDVTKPTLTITAPIANQKMTNALAKIVGSASDNWKVTGVWYQLNNGNWDTVTTTNNFTNWSKLLTLIAGTNTVKAYAQDLGGNVSLTNSVSFISSNTFKLQLVVTNPPTASNGLTISLQASLGLGGQVQYSTNLSNWTALGSFYASNSPVVIRDLGATNSNKRFYRAFVSP
jgi:hypothetical protein